MFCVTRVRLAAIVALATALSLPGCIPLQTTDDDTSGTVPEINDPYDENQRAEDNQAPTANAGDDQTVNAGQTVTLSGNHSTDPDGDALTYLWRQSGGSPQVELLAPFSALVRFTAPADLDETVTLEFTLTVADGYASATDQITVTVQP
ncbi:MAG: PKD domain-containing protein [Phycisphaerae bacterium]|jgi:hypothetical protein